MPDPQPKIIEGLAHPLWFRPHTTDKWCLKKVFVDREYAIDFSEQPKLIIDAGANVGYASVFFANRYPNAKVLAIEPESENFALLSRNAEPYGNIVPIHAALWHSPEQVAISDPGKGAWGFRTSARSGVRETVEFAQGVTVQQIIEEYGVSQIDLLKIDIEGSEKQVFEHSVDWIERVQVIVIELHDRFAPGCTAAFNAATNSGFPVRLRRGENTCVARKGVPRDKLPTCHSRIDKLAAYGATANRIVATMLCGTNEAIVAESVRSVIDWVDAFLLIDTGITDDSVQVAREIAGDKLLVRTFEWCNDFARARNFSLEAAAAAGATWALTIDTDERLMVSGYDGIEQLRAVLSSDPAVRAWLVPARDGSYDKERLIRVPTLLQWMGRTHESLVGAAANERRVLPGCKFFEERKTPEQFQRKLQRDLVILKEETRDQPDNARWWYYLGQTHEELGQFAAAIEAYQRCFEIREGWAEQAAWACFNMAKCHSQLGQFNLAVEACALGLARQPASPELAWQAAYCCYESGRHRDAILWAQIAVRLGHYEGVAAGKERISFRNLTGWYEGPYDVMRFAHRRLGEHVKANAAERKYHAAQELRLRGSAAGQPLTSLSSGIQGARTCVAVLGTYSSGSSAVAGVLHHLGVVMGRQFHGDHFEAAWMADQFRRWWKEPDLEQTSMHTERISVFRQWLHEMRRDFGCAVGLKHPLLALCCNDLVEAWGNETKFIWSHRALEESIASLQRRKWWPGKEQAIQSRLYSAAETFFANRPHLTIEFSDLKAHPTREIDRIIAHLQLSPTDEQCQTAVTSIVV